MAKEKIRQERIEKLNKLKEAGIDPFGSKVNITGNIEHVRSLCPAGEVEPENAPEVTIAGRAIAVRNMGKSVWIDIADRSGKVQINLLQKRIENFDQTKLLDIGDFLEVRGPIMKSRRGEVTIFASYFRFICKSLEPLPAKFKGLKDVEIRYRRRYLDLAADEEARSIFIKRSKIIKFVRDFLENKDFLEVETPMLQSIYGGAAARPFTTHHNTLDLDLFMRISPETYLKRLLVGGMDRVYEINRSFRNEGIDTSHNPEFTMIEIYQAYADFKDMMDLTESLVSTCAEEILGTTRITYGEHEIDLKALWPRKKMSELISEYAGVDSEDAEAMRARLVQAGFAPEDAAKLERGKLMAEIMDEIVEPKLIQPTFVTHYPAILNPLCKRNTEDPEFTDRFEVIVAGMELGNAFSELNDPLDQLARFEEQVTPTDEEGYCNAIDYDYVSALEVGMPPAGGLGIGIDRLTMLLTGQTSIREVILFPTMKPRTSAEQQAIDEAEDEAKAEE